MLKISHLLNAFILSTTALISASSFAGYVSVSVGGSAYLNSCGGTVEVNNGGNDNQVNLVFRGVNQCSFYEDSEGNRQRLNLGYSSTNAYTISTANQNSLGSHTIRVYLRSKKGGHSETIDVSYYVNSNGYDPRPSGNHNPRGHRNPRGNQNQRPSYSAVLEACINYTSTAANQTICTAVMSDPKVTYGCKQYTSTKTGEGICLTKQLSPATAKACKDFTWSNVQEEACLLAAN